jgi:two-component system LytT family response regulator
VADGDDVTDRPGLRVLIADDERPARAKVRRFLERDPDVAFIHEAWDGPTTRTVIREAAPDLVLLDIEMPGERGIDLIASLTGAAVPHVIFVTAHDDYAVRAFELAAVDYLLKPFDAERFELAMQRAKDALDRGRDMEDVRRLARLVAEFGGAGRPPLTRIAAAHRGGRRVLIDANDIDWLEAERNYVRVHTATGCHLVRGPLAALEARLDPTRFARAGRGAVVNIARITHIEPAGHGDAVLVLRSGTRVRLSRRYAHALERRLAP